MNVAELNQDPVRGGSADDSGKDSDEEELSKAKEKFEDFFKRTKKYWISFARDRLSRSKDECICVEEYALVLAEEEFMKETIPALSRNSRRRDHERNDAIRPQPPALSPDAPLQQRVNQLQHQLQRVELDEGIEWIGDAYPSDNCFFSLEIN